MNNIVVSEIILTVVSLLILSINIVYQNYQIRRINKKIEYNESESKNYEIILNNMLNRKK